MRLKDLIREFAPEAKTQAPEPAPMPEAAPALATGAEALVMVEVLDTIDSICKVLDEESAAMGSGEFGELEAFARRKHGIAERLERVMVQLADEEVALNADLRAMLLERVERLDRSISVNTAGLVAMRKAVLSINRTLLNALERAASDGLYSAAGHAVRPPELSASGLDKAL